MLGPPGSNDSDRNVSEWMTNFVVLISLNHILSIPESCSVYDVPHKLKNRFNDYNKSLEDYHRLLEIADGLNYLKFTATIDAMRDLMGYVQIDPSETNLINTVNMPTVSLDKFYRKVILHTVCYDLLVKSLGREPIYSLLSGPNCCIIETEMTKYRETTQDPNGQYRNALVDSQGPQFKAFYENNEEWLLVDPTKKPATEMIIKQQKRFIKIISHLKNNATNEN